MKFLDKGNSERSSVHDVTVEDYTDEDEEEE
jgi:hypothetical protein